MLVDILRPGQTVHVMGGAECIKQAMGGAYNQYGTLSISGILSLACCICCLRDSRSVSVE